MATSSYYVPDSSYFPIVASFGLIGMAAGGGGACIAVAPRAPEL